MRNLKRVLALALATMTLFSTFATASYTDTNEMDSTQAVEMLTTLGIINGYGDGTFRPENSITKAELAKIIYVVRNGGTDDGGSNFIGMASELTDISGHWAEGYISYGYAYGIIAGNGNGKFEPEKSVTGYEAAKMLLTVIGYDADRAGLVGNDWQKNTLLLATDKDLFEDYNIAFQLASNRENAAQMVYNSLFSITVKYSDGAYEDVYVNSDPTTMGEKYLGLDISTGVLLSTGNYELGEVAGSGEDKIVVAKDSGETITLSYSDNVSHLIGRNVEIVSNAKTDEIYGLYASDKNTELVTELGKIELSDDVLYVDGTKIDYATDAKTYTGETEDTFENTFAATINSGAKVTFISNNNDDKYDIAIIDDTRVGKVTGVYKDRLGTDITGYASVDLDDVISYDGIKTGDIITLNEDLFTGYITVNEIDYVSGDVVGARDGEVRVGDTWYSLADNKLSGVSLPSLGDTVKIYALGSYIYNVEVISEIDTDMAFVIAVGTTADFDGNYEAKIIFNDGSTKVVTVSEALTAKTFATYSIKDGVYTLTEISADNLAGFDGFISGNTGYVSSTEMLGDTDISDSAVIFVQYVDDGTTVNEIITGADLKDLDADFGDSFVALTNEISGFDYVMAASIVSSSKLPSISGDESYGYVVEVPYTAYIDGETYVVYSVFNGEEVIELLVEGSTVVASLGDVISFDMISDNVINSEAVISLTDAAVIAYSETSGNIKFADDENTYKITDDTTIIYIDSEEFEGYEGGSIKLADQSDADTYVNNVSFKASTTTSGSAYVLEYIIVDVNNQMQ